ncbi:MAG: glycoside hydrolase family 5 protein [Cellvibrio sp.]|uniref:glycoside hydrolase family 5 protein n=1 Tax=Cellvibrio sp. TaxID=1965322 RepID=UPI0031A6198A
MRILMALVLSSSLLTMAACGGGGGGGSTPAPASSKAAVSSPASSPASSVAVSSSLGLSSSTPATSSSSTPATAGLYPSYNLNPLPADGVGMESSAIQIASKIRLGFNIGNTLEATGGKSETYWGNPKITKEFVAFVKQSGFSAIRLPVSWDQYANQTTAEIDANWLARVKEVVQYGVDSDLYVIVNIHWDGGWLENNVVPGKQAQNNAKQKAFWEQIATLLRDFDERVLFASANEPNVEDAAQMAVLNSYHQTFVDTVRATGGKNAQRVLIVQGPATDIDKTNKLWTQMPTDTVTGKLMTEIHFYSPWNYTGMTKDESWGNQFFYWGKGFHSTTDTAHNPTWGEEDYVDAQFKLMKTQFVDKGIPVIMGEYGTGVRKNLTGADLQLHLDGRAHYLNYLTKQAIANGLVPFLWDIGELLDRTNNKVLDQKAFDALMTGAAQ